MAPIRRQLSGLAFWPGGKGYITDNLPVGGLMFLGQDFQNEEYMQRLFNENKETEVEEPGTWQKLRELLRLAEIDSRDCFFTNCFDGLRPGKTKPMGLSPAWDDPDLIKLNQIRLRQQIDAQQPRRIFALGLPAVHFLGGTLDEAAGWRSNRLPTSKKDIPTNYQVDRVYGPIQGRCVFITHPANYAANVRHRLWKEPDKLWDVNVALLRRLR